jgi:hypothetical protein
MAHLGEPIDVAALAHMTKRSQFHFSRAAGCEMTLRVLRDEAFPTWRAASAA